MIDDTNCWEIQYQNRFIFHRLWPKQKCKSGKQNETNMLTVDDYASASQSKGKENKTCPIVRKQKWNGVQWNRTTTKWEAKIGNQAFY